MSKRLVLFSQPSPEVFEKLKPALFPPNLTNNVFAYMPAEGDNFVANAEYTPPWQEYAIQNKATFIVIDNSTRGDESVIEAQKILSANILMISGGNTFKLLNHLRKSGLNKAIIDFWQKDNIVLAGSSAGAIVLSPSIETAKTGVADTNDPGLSDLTGLNIFDFEVWPHYEPSEKPQVDQFIQSRNIKLKTISNDEVIIIDK